MTDTIVANIGDVLGRGQSHLQTERERATPIAVRIIIAVLCFAGILCACGAEYYSSGVAFASAFPAKSDGTGLADELTKLRWPLIFAILIGSTLLHAIPNRVKPWLDGLLHSIGVWIMLMLLAGLGVFMFSTTFLTLGSGSEQGLASWSVGFGLALASSAMFGLSFLAAHAMMSRLFEVVPIIFTGLAERREIRTGEALIAQTEAHQVRRDALRATIAEMEQPQALERKAANEIGVITGDIIAEGHDILASRKVLGDHEPGPDDRVHVPTTPFEVLQERYNDVKQYTAAYFLNILLKQKES